MQNRGDVLPYSTHICCRRFTALFLWGMFICGFAPAAICCRRFVTYPCRPSHAPTPHHFTNPTLQRPITSPIPRSINPSLHHSTNPSSGMFRLQLLQEYLNHTCNHQQYSSNGKQHGTIRWFSEPDEEHPGTKSQQAVHDHPCREGVEG